MSVEAVFNDLSPRAPALDLEAGMRWMVRLVDTLVSCGKAGTSRVLRTPRNFGQILLAEGYPIGRWANDKAVDADRRRVLTTWAAKSPFLEDLEGTPTEQKYGRSEVHFNGELAEGLGVAYLLDGLAVSFEADAIWATPTIEVRSFAIDQSLQDVIERVARIRHASIPAHVSAHATWIAERRRSDFSSGKEFWAQRNEMFPNLDFCATAEGQILTFDSGDVRLTVAVNGLLELQDYCAKWTQGPFVGAVLRNASSESAPTLQQYGTDREFRCPDGVTRVFSWHLKRGSLRIHFIADAERKRILVGYVGRHLPTVRYPN